MAKVLDNNSQIARLLNIPSPNSDRIQLRDIDREQSDRGTIAYSHSMLLENMVAPDAQILAKPHPLNAEEIYRLAFPELQRHARMRPAPGLLALGFDPEGQIFGSLWLRLGRKTPQSFIIGRHNYCDLLVPAEFSSVSLRHLATLLWYNPKDGLSLRVLDLHTPLGFFDEAGRVQKAVESDGPLFLGLGNITVAILLCGPELLDFADADSAYSALPQRHFELEEGLQEKVLEPQVDTADEKNPFDAGRETEQHALKALAQKIQAVVDKKAAEEEEEPDDYTPSYRSNSRVVTKSGLAKYSLDSPASVLEKGESCFGLAKLSSEEYSISVELGLKALQRGVAVGRYERCVIGSTGQLPNLSYLSRVHVFLIMIDGQLMAIDTASTNGVFYQEEEVRQIPLKDGDRLELNGHYTLKWYDYHNE